MTSGTYRPGKTGLQERYSEREYFVNDRFYPGEFGAVIILGIAALLVWSVAIYGLTTYPAAQMPQTMQGQ